VQHITLPSALFPSLALLVSVDILRRCLGIESTKGTLRPGADADFVVLNRFGEVVCTWVKGKELWRRNSHERMV
jgi:N-acetylglucosamine-6-phosphate deacetylase